MIVSTVSQVGNEGMRREQRFLFVAAAEQEPNESNMSALHSIEIGQLPVWHYRYRTNFPRV